MNTQKLEAIKKHFTALVASQGCIYEDDYHSACYDIKNSQLIGELNTWMLTAIPMKKNRPSGPGKVYRQRLREMVSKPDVKTFEKKYNKHANKDQSASFHLNKALEELEDKDYKTEFFAPWDRKKVQKGSLKVEALKKPPKEWFDKKFKEVKEGNPSYTDEQARGTVGKIWYENMSKSQKQEETKKREGNVKAIAQQSPVVPEQQSSEPSFDPTAVDSFINQIEEQLQEVKVNNDTETLQSILDFLNNKNRHPTHVEYDISPEITETTIKAQKALVGPTEQELQQLVDLAKQQGWIIAQQGDVYIARPEGDPTAAPQWQTQDINELSDFVLSLNPSSNVSALPDLDLGAKKTAQEALRVESQVIPAQNIQEEKQYLIDTINARSSEIDNAKRWIQTVEATEDFSQLQEIWRQLFGARPDEPTQTYQRWPDAAPEEYGFVDFTKASFDFGSFDVHVADTVEKKSAGLEPFEKLDVDKGMLFPFDNNAHVTFHMGKVKFPIDIIFLMESGLGLKVAKIVHNAQPGVDSVWSFPNTKCVLELSGGICKEKGIKIGDLCSIGAN